MFRILLAHFAHMWVGINEILRVYILLTTFNLNVGNWLRFWDELGGYDVKWTFGSADDTEQYTFGEHTPIWWSPTFSIWYLLCICSHNDTKMNFSQRPSRGQRFCLRRTTSNCCLRNRISKSFSLGVIRSKHIAFQNRVTMLWIRYQIMPLSLSLSSIYNIWVYLIWAWIRFFDLTGDRLPVCTVI